MDNIYDVIRFPLVTEKSTTQKVSANQVSFKVDIKATKPQIKKAVEKIFKVSVTNVRTVVVEGKEKRLGRYLGKRADWKKAIVTLKTGDKIEYFEGV